MVVFEAIKAPRRRRRMAAASSFQLNTTADDSSGEISALNCAD